MRRAWLLLLVAGCKDPPPGALISVAVPVPADHVRLLASADDCDQCPGIAPAPQGTKRIDGDVHFIDDGTKLVDDDIAPDVDGIARFQLLSPQTTSLTLAAVAYDASDHAVAAALVDDPVTVSPNASTLVTIQLLPVTSAQAFTWKDDADPNTSCTVIKENNRKPAFFVPTLDPDCDGILEDKECDPLAYHSASFMPDLTQTDCQTIGSSNTCHLGENGCAKDGDGPASCQGFDTYCVPSADCDNMCSPFDDGCIGPIVSAGAISRVTCTLPFDVVGYCNGGSAPLAIAANLQKLTDATCDGVGFVRTPDDLPNPPTTLATQAGPVFQITPGGDATCGSLVGSFVDSMVQTPVEVSDDAQVVFELHGGRFLMFPLHVDSQLVADCALAITACEVIASNTTEQIAGCAN